MIYSSDDLSFQVLAVLRLQHREGYYEVKRRPFAAISFKLSGGAEFEMMGKRVRVEPKNIVYVPANADYKVRYTEPNDTIVIHLTECNYGDPESIFVENKDEIERLFLNLLSSWERNHSLNQAKSCIYDILYRLPKTNYTSRGELFSEITEYISGRYTDADLDVARLCSVFGVSRSFLQKLFAECSGVSPKQFIINLRAERVLYLLSTTDCTLKEIASLSGFSDEKYLSRLVKEKYGDPPSVLKRNMAI